MKKIVCLLSGGIDSPVAAAMLSKKYDVVLVHFEISSTEKKIAKLAEAIAKHSKKKVRLYMVPHSENLKKLSAAGKKSTCVMCKRMMYRIANKIALKEGAEAIATGDSLAQVASQTLKNLRAEDAASDLPVFRPLIGLEKSEIIEIAKQIGTYEISIQKGESKCPGVPQYPETRAEISETEMLEENVDMEQLVNDSIGRSRTMDLG